MEKPLSPLLLAMNQPIVYNDLQAVFLAGYSIRHGPGWRCPAHVHSYFESHQVTEGRVYTTLDGREMRVQAGQYYIIPPGTVHSHWVPEGEEDAGICFRWTMEKRKNPEPDVPPVADDMLRAFSQAIAAPFPADRQCAPFVQEDILYSVAEAQIALLRWLGDVYGQYRYAVGTDGGRPHQHLSDRQLVDSVLITLSTLHAGPLTAQEVAAMHQVSYRQLARVFKRETGKTVMEALTDARMAHAMQLLTETDLPVMRIGEMVGYTNACYFSNVFARTYGMAPSQARGFRKKEDGKL